VRGTPAREINMARFRRKIGIVPVTVHKWFDILRATYQWRKIPVFSGNAVKHLSGKSKDCLTDTGLACLLRCLGSVEAFNVSPLRGALSETFVANGPHKQFTTLEAPPGIYH
jgi:predicted AAA+ superfamily ATPase